MHSNLLLRNYSVAPKLKPPSCCFNGNIIVDDYIKFENDLLITSDKNSIVIENLKLSKQNDLLINVISDLQKQITELRENIPYHYHKHEAAITIQRWYRYYYYLKKTEFYKKSKNVKSDVIR